MSFIGKVSYFGQNASNKMKDTAEIVKISGQLTNNTKQIEELYQEIGRQYCAAPPETAAAQVATLVQHVRMLQQQNEVLEQQVQDLKGVVTCPRCGNQYKNGTPFCSSCGYQFPCITTEICRKCGSPLEQGQGFCTICGTPVSAPGPAPAVQSAAPAMKRCIHCGKEIRADLKFCKYCGKNTL